MLSVVYITILCGLIDFSFKVIWIFQQKIPQACPAILSGDISSLVLLRNKFLTMINLPPCGARLRASFSGDCNCTFYNAVEMSLLARGFMIFFAS